MVDHGMTDITLNELEEQIAKATPDERPVLEALRDRLIRLQAEDPAPEFEENMKR